MKVLIAVSTLFLVAGCAQLAPVRQNIVIGVQKYCESFTQEQRALFREEVKAGLATVCVTLADGTKACGASLTVTCPGDTVQ